MALGGPSRAHIRKTKTSPLKEAHKEKKRGTEKGREEKKTSEDCACETSAL